MHIHLINTVPQHLIYYTTYPHSTQTNTFYFEDITLHTHRGWGKQYTIHATKTKARMSSAIRLVVIPPEPFLDDIVIEFEAIRGE